LTVAQREMVRRAAERFTDHGKRREFLARVEARLRIAGDPHPPDDAIEMAVGLALTGLVQVRST
jgi:hypothetical protein